MPYNNIYTPPATGTGSQSNQFMNWASQGVGGVPIPTGGDASMTRGFAGDPTKGVQSPRTFSPPPFQFPWGLPAYYQQQQQQAQPQNTAMPNNTNPGQSGYNSSPFPLTYNSTYGGIPGMVDIPNPYQDLSKVLPNLGGLNSQASQDLQSLLGGQLSPGTVNMLQDQNAAWAAANGVPLSGLANNRLARNLGLTSESLVEKGLGAYPGILGSISSTQTVNPSLQAQIAERNANIRSAPNPADAQSYAQRLFNNYLNRLRGPGGGSGGYGSPAGGTGTYAGSGALGFGFGGNIGNVGAPSGGTGTIGDISSGSLGNDFGSGPNDFSGFGNLPTDEDMLWQGFGDPVDQFNLSDLEDFNF